MSNARESSADADKRDVPAAQVVLLDTSHFALVEEIDAIAERTDRFLRRVCGSNRLSAAFRRKDCVGRSSGSALVDDHAR